MTWIRNDRLPYKIQLIYKENITSLADGYTAAFAKCSGDRFRQFGRKINESWV